MDLRFVISSFIFIATIGSGAQGRHRTVVIIMATDKDVVIAADSRTLNSEPLGTEQLIRDDYCKLHNLQDRVVFAGVNLINFRFPQGGEFNTYQVAAQILHGTPIVTRDDLARVARRWAEGVRKKLDSSISPFLSPYKGGIGGIFAFSDHDGQFRIVEAWLQFRESGVRPPFASHTDEPRYHWFEAKQSSSAPSIYFFGTGGNLASAYLADKAHDAEKSALGITGDGTIFSYKDLARVSDNLARLAIRLSSLNRGVGGPSDVGGPIDQIRISRNGTEWLRRKQNCDPAE
jgi:hypothetical protein